MVNNKLAREISGGPEHKSSFTLCRCVISHSSFNVPVCRQVDLHLCVGGVHFPGLEDNHSRDHLFSGMTQNNKRLGGREGK